MRLSLRSTIIVCLLCTFSCLSGYSQSEMATAAPAPAQLPEIGGHTGEAGIGVKVSLLGAGIEGAVRVADHANVRAGFNMIRYDRGFNKDGIDYKGQLNFQTIEAHLDYFPWAKSFHISPGLLVYAVDPITATALVPGNQNFTLGGTTYYSNPANPATANGKITFYRAAPMITVGWGNLVSRKEGKHFSVPFEIGVAFQGSPKATLGFAGSVCDQPGVNCRSVLTDSNVQSHIISEQNKINNDMSFFKVYPIISVGIGYKF
jgi:hypothetical protein